jgi:hypothetical protein
MKKCNFSPETPISQLVNLNNNTPLNHQQLKMNQNQFDEDSNFGEEFGDDKS